MQTAQDLYEVYVSLPVGEQLAFNRRVQDFLMNYLQQMLDLQAAQEKQAWNTYSLQGISAAFSEEEEAYQLSDIQ